MDVTLRLTGFVSLSRLVRPLLPAPARAGAHANLELEWDVVVTTDPVRAAEAISAADAATNGTSSEKPEQVRLRGRLRSGADSVADAATRPTESAQCPLGESQRS
ncbi:hypothetical protein ACFP2T_17860 [Plantactinospora solaniradicis]|uniref:Uncharacterized protein n=1 Tax=Plantactinospora solaniradicis TaxID=1723736 RepID=A0ABW1KA22_9ACTN